MRRLLITANVVPSSPILVTVATFADDTALLATDSDLGIVSQKLQNNLGAFQNWLKK
jgi:hypothetical protein